MESATINEVNCRVPEDLYTPGARRLLARMCQGYLTEHVLTPTELLHSARAQERLLNAGPLYQALVQKLAMARSRTTKVSIAVLVKEIHLLTDATIMRTRRRQMGAPVPDITSLGCDVALAQISTHDAPYGHFYEINYALSTHLGKCKTWAQKLTALLDLAESVKDATGQACIDALLDDAFGIDAAMREVLTPKAGLQNALLTLLAILGGTAPPGGSTELAERLARLIGQDRLANALPALNAQIRRAIDSRGRLLSDSSSEELAAYCVLFGTIADGGARLATWQLETALEQRLLLFLRPEVLHEILKTDADPADRLAAALKLHRGLPNGASRPEVRRAIDRIFEQDRLADTLKKRPGPLAPKLQQIVLLRQALVDADLPGSQCERYTEVFDGLQASLIADNRLFEQLEQTSPAECVRRLVAMTKAGMFTPGTIAGPVRRALTRALAHPDFAQSFLGDGDQASNRRNLLALMGDLQKLGIFTA